MREDDGRDGQMRGYGYLNLLRVAEIRVTK